MTTKGETIMERIDIELLEDERPNLLKEVRLRNITELYKLNDTPTDKPAEQAAKKTWILLARGERNDYIILSTKGKPDRFTTWIHYGDSLAGSQQEPPGAGYIVIDKEKVGRPRRELTADEVQEIRARHAAGDSINKIAKALHLGTRRIMGALQQT